MSNCSAIDQNLALPGLNQFDAKIVIVNINSIQYLAINDMVEGSGKRIIEQSALMDHSFLNE